MGVPTRADELVQQLKRLNDDCAIVLSDIVIHKCYGYNDYNPDYQNKLKECLNLVLKIRDNLE